MSTSELIPAPLPAKSAAAKPRPERLRPRLDLPLALFAATCFSTFFVSAIDWDLLTFLSEPLNQLGKHWWQGLVYMTAVMAILSAHEMGHFLQAVRYRVPASLPFFIPMPITPLGTMGAVIGMRGSQADRRELFDIGLTGPWAGLAVALPLAWIGIRSAQPLAVDPYGYFGDPLVFKLLVAWLRPDVLPDTHIIGHANPLVMASWVGMLVTGLNMLPIGQLDGGHVTYALMGPSLALAGAGDGDGHGRVHRRWPALRVVVDAALGRVAASGPSADRRRLGPAGPRSASDRLVFGNVADLLPHSRALRAALAPSPADAAATAGSWHWLACALRATLRCLWLWR